MGVMKQYYKFTIHYHVISAHIPSLYNISKFDQVWYITDNIIEFALVGASNTVNLIIEYKNAYTLAQNNDGNDDNDDNSMKNGYQMNAAIVNLFINEKHTL